MNTKFVRLFILFRFNFLVILDKLLLLKSNYLDLIIYIFSFNLLQLISTILT